MHPLPQSISPPLTLGQDPNLRKLYLVIAKTVQMLRHRQVAIWQSRTDGKVTIWQSRHMAKSSYGEVATWQSRRLAKSQAGDVYGSHYFVRKGPEVTAL